MTKPAVSILTPTRGRPASVDRLIDSALSTTELDIEMLFYVDEDDPARDETLAVIAKYHPAAVAIVGQRIVLSETWNQCYQYARADVLMHCGDDIVFRSRHWAEAVLREFNKYPDRIVLVHGRDGIQDDRLATHGWYHRRWVDTVGYFMPPYFESDWNDMWWTEVADKLGRRVYLSHVFTEHMHPVVGKGPLDATHQERLTRHQQQDSDRVYRDRDRERAMDVQKLLTVIREAVPAS